MTRIALEATNYELIKAHILDPENSPLPAELAGLLNRVISVAKVLDTNPITRHAVAIHHTKYPEITRQTAYSDIRLAMKLFNSIHTFNWDFWMTWLINNIVANIQKCRNAGTEKDRRIIAMEHANLLKAIGQKPELLPDADRLEKQQICILIQNNNQQIKVDLNNIQDLPPAALAELNKFIYAGAEISTDLTDKLFES